MNALAAEVLPPEPTQQAVPLTLEGWANLEEDEPGEFVDGKIVEEEVPSHLHEAVVSWLMFTLGAWGRQHRALVLGSEHKLGPSRARGRKPDVCMYAPGTRLRDAALSRKPPMLIVEVLSKQPRDVKRDRHEKRIEYAKFGVQHYWIVDPQARFIEFLALGPTGTWNNAWSASEGRVEVPGIDGLMLDLDQLWAEIDEYIEGEEEEEVDIVTDDEG